MDLVLKTISTDKTVRSNTVNDLKEFNNQSSTTQVKKGKQWLSMILAIKKDFDWMGDDIVDLSTENNALKHKIGSYEKKWLLECKAKLLKQIDDE